MNDCRTCTDELTPCDACPGRFEALAEMHAEPALCAAPRRLDDGVEMPLPMAAPVAGPSLAGLVGPLADLPFSLVAQTITRTAAQPCLFPEVKR